MRNKKLAALTIFLLLVLLGVHVYAMDEYLYIKISFLDTILHFLGGVCLALSSFYILKSKKYIIPITFFLGIVWEVFEVYYDLTGWPFGSSRYYSDTLHDLIMDTLGALVVWLIIKYKKNESISNIS